MMVGGGGGHAHRDGKSRITIITFRVSQFTENNIVNEEQRTLHIDSFTLEVLERPPIIVNVSFESYSFMS